MSAHGAERDDHLWEGWLVIEPVNGGAPRRTERETTQPNRDDLLYWASGLEATYLEGALERALRQTSALREQSPATDIGAEADSGVQDGETPGAQPHPILDPFKVAGQGGGILHKELLALSGERLREIIRAFRLVDEAQVNLQGLGRAELASMIVGAVHQRGEGGVGHDAA